jgi:hypothetical protein
MFTLGTSDFATNEIVPPFLGDLLTEAEYLSVSHLAFKVVRRNKRGELVAIHDSGSMIVFQEKETVTLKLGPAERLEVCSKGLHACRHPWNCFSPEYGYNIFFPDDVLMIVDIVGVQCYDPKKIKLCTDVLTVVKVLTEDQKTLLLKTSSSETRCIKRSKITSGKEVECFLTTKDVCGGISRTVFMRGVLYLVLRGRFGVLDKEPVRSDVTEAEMMGWLASIPPSTLHKCIPDLDAMGDPNIWVVRNLVEVCFRQGQLRLAEWIVNAGLMLFDKCSVSRIAMSTRDSSWSTLVWPMTSSLHPRQITFWCPALESCSFWLAAEETCPPVAPSRIVFTRASDTRKMRPWLLQTLVRGWARTLGRFLQPSAPARVCLVWTA